MKLDNIIFYPNEIYLIFEYSNIRYYDFIKEINFPWKNKTEYNDKYMFIIIDIKYDNIDLNELKTVIRDLKDIDENLYNDLYRLYPPSTVELKELNKLLLSNSYNLVIYGYLFLTRYNY